MTEQKPSFKEPLQEVQVTMPDGTVETKIRIDYDALNNLPPDEDYVDLAALPIPENLTISRAERERRLDAVIAARANSMLSGSVLTKEERDYDDALDMKWVNGEITEEELDAAPRLICGELVHIKL